MKPTTEILARISQNSLANKEEVFTKLYRYLLRPDIYFVAYKNLYANNGAATKGVNEDTADGFSEAKIDSIIKALADETYQPMPVRRTYIQKKNNRKTGPCPKHWDRMYYIIISMWYIFQSWKSRSYGPKGAKTNHLWEPSRKPLCR